MYSLAWLNGCAGGGIGKYIGFTDFDTATSEDLPQVADCLCLALKGQFWADQKKKNRISTQPDMFIFSFDLVLQNACPTPWEAS